MLEILHDLFSYTFIVRALIVGTLVSLCAALLGVSLVLKRYSMIGDGLSHVGFGALAVAMAFNWAPLPVAIPVVVVAAFLLLRLSEKQQNKRDSGNCIVASSSLRHWCYGHLFGLRTKCRCVQLHVRKYFSYERK